MVDFDGDGEISFREAHLYAIYASTSTDIPRSTSEVYLDAWRQPWYLRWLSYDEQPQDSVYALAARRIAQSLTLDSKNLLAAARKAEHQIALLDKDIASTESDIESGKAEVQKLQKALKKQVLMRWPQLANPYDDAFIQFFAGADVEAFTRWADETVDYTSLVEAQDDLRHQEKHLLELNRKRASFLRLKRMVRMNRLQARLMKYGTRAEQEAYRRLVACENWIPKLSTAKIAETTEKCKDR